MVSSLTKDFVNLKYNKSLLNLLKNLSINELTLYLQAFNWKEKTKANKIFKNSFCIRN